ncbi:NAD-dependent epimerase/dehydratase family protein [Methylopila turkensis]|uniref:NAD-dependent epimerase/dehydratase domain-containing protein n=1 Tax=Methylopila turkensis TaxID=1437816 RepID=A0A9W6JT97_9HYPH|nr:NAD(P)-dependent oxidoreductase [Methylopila turkensis]GLK81899.1 hypothetical protein GCM10008174_36400 [Methylopila turkensis]
MSEHGVALVTGAGGFIGSAVATRLADVGYQVRAGLRSSALPETLRRREGLVATPCDLDQPGDLRAAVDGADVVVHAAYGPDAEMEPQCRRLLAAMAEAGCGALVHFSSIAVYGEREGAIVESDGPVGSPGGYGDAKIACEAAIAAWAGERPADRRALLLRPGAVYGRGSRFWVDKTRARLEAGALGDLGPAGDGVAPLIHVDDVAEMTFAAVRRLTDVAPFEGVAALNLVGPETPSWNRYFADLAAAAGLLAPRSIGAVERAFRAALLRPAQIGRRLGLPGLAGLALSPAPGERALFARRAAFSTEAAERVLLTSAVIGLKDGLARSV